jgi:hypothetical protein
MAEYDVERMWRDARLLEIGGGSNEALDATSPATSRAERLSHEKAMSGHTASQGGTQP